MYLMSWRTLMSYFSFNKSDPDADLDNPRGGPSHRCNGAFECGGIDGKLGGLTPMNSYARLVCIRGIKINRPRSLAVTRQRVIVVNFYRHEIICTGNMVQSN